jgi:hypothetical protein
MAPSLFADPDSAAVPHLGGRQTMYPLPDISLRQRNALQAHVRQHYALPGLKGPLPANRKQRSWRLIYGKVMVYSRQRYGLSHTKHRADTPLDTGCGRSDTEMAY